MQSSLATSILLALASCSGNAVTTESTSTTQLENGTTQITTHHAIEYSFDPEIRYELSMTSVTGQPSVTTTTVNGLALVLESNGFRVGSREYGDLESGDSVRFAAEGIFVNGTRRWDLPTE